MISLAFLILSLFVVGCSSEQPHNEFLTKAEEMVFEKPDSVVRLLAPRWYDTQMNEADRALYGLLYTEALHRSGLLTEADSLILFSRKYYKERGDEEHLSRALLHHAIILYKQKLVHEAVLTMKEAEHMAQDMDQPAFKWYLYSVLGDVNDNVGNYTQTLRYYKQALEEARRYKKDEWIVQTLNNIATTFDLLGQTDSLKYYTDLAQPFAPKTNGEIRATYLVNKASYLMSLGKRQEAKRLLNESMLCAPTDRASKLLADIYMKEGNMEAAVQQWYRLTNSFSPDVCIQSYRMLIQYLDRKGDKAAVAEYSQRLNEVYQKLYERSDAAGVIDMQAQYDEQQKERRQYRTTIALLAAIILIAIGATIIIRYSRRRIDLLNARFLESQKKYDLTRSELTQMRHQKEREMKENSQQLKAVIARLHASANKGRVADDEDLNSLAQFSYALSPELQVLLSVLNTKEQAVCLLIRHNFQPTEIAALTISTPQTITNTRVRLLKKLFGQTGGAKDFDAAIKAVN